jgi:hypothetical protein
MMHSELIEWRICKVTRQRIEGERSPGMWTFHSEGAQSTFGLTRAKKILKVLGPGWEIRHSSTFEPPTEEK